MLPCFWLSVLHPFPVYTVVERETRRFADHAFAHLQGHLKSVGTCCLRMRRPRFQFRRILSSTLLPTRSLGQSIGFGRLHAGCRHTPGPGLSRFGLHH